MIINVVMIHIIYYCLYFTIIIIVIIIFGLELYLIPTYIAIHTYYLHIIILLSEMIDLENVISSIIVIIINCYH